jgi:hypothetical protein
VGEDLQDEDISGVVVNGGDEAVMVSCDIENGDGLAAGYLCGLGMGECLAHFLNASPEAYSCSFMPCGKGYCGVRVKSGVFIEAAACDDSHEVLSVVNMATSGKMSRCVAFREFGKLGGSVVVVAALH